MPDWKGWLAGMGIGPDRWAKGPGEGGEAVPDPVEAEVLPRFVDGSLRPVVDSRYALDAVADAHRRMEANANVGKVLIDL